MGLVVHACNFNPRSGQAKRIACLSPALAEQKVSVSENQTTKPRKTTQERKAKENRAQETVAVDSSKSRDAQLRG